LQHRVAQVAGGYGQWHHAARSELMASKIPTRAQAIFDRHYEFHARYGGDEHPKKSAAEAKRVSTSLRKALAQFSPLLLILP
jgi:hypothetical protein